MCIVAKNSSKNKSQKSRERKKEIDHDRLAQAMKAAIKILRENDVDPKSKRWEVGK